MPAVLTPEVVLAALDAVKDPEIPVVSVVDLGIIQGVTIEGHRVTVSITPTFTGCPALEVMRQEIAAVVRGLGAVAVAVPVVLDPPWSTDRITPAARERM
ncbi:MAG: iron-sulfur cluster assembly protein, partial [Anaerolineae bacterium]